MIPNDTVRRVTARFTGAEPDNDNDIEVLGEQVLSTDQLRDELERRFGPMDVMTVHDPQDGSGVASWEAISAEGSTVRGTVSVTSVWLDGRLILMPEIEIAGAVGPLVAKAAAVPRQLLDDRLHHVAVRLRRLLTEVRAQPQRPSTELVKKLQRIVELAEKE